METRINPEQVSHIYIKYFEKTRSFYLSNHTTKYFFGLFKDVTKEGYYFINLFDDLRFDWTMAEVAEFDNMVDIDGYLHYKPSVSIFCAEK